MRSRLTGSRLRATIAAVCGAAFMLFGYDQGVMGAVISLPSFRRQFDNPSTNLEGIISSMYDIGCFLGAIIAFVASEKLGRKGSIYCGTAIMVVGTVLQTSAFEKIQMILSRILTGIGNGINTCAVPIWQAECFDAKNRGLLLVIQSALIAFGNPLSTFMGLASSQAEPSGFAWRWPIAFQGLFCVIILAALPFVPESPRWLVAHGRIEEAAEVFAALASADREAVEVVSEVNTVQASVEEERRLGSATWGEVFTEGKLRNISRVLLGAGPYLFNQWSGINSLGYYLPITFERNIGLSKELSLIIAGVLGIQYFLASWLPMLLIDRFGRRQLLIWSSSACSVCMIIISLMLAYDSPVRRWVFVAFCFIFFDVFSWGILPVSWMYAAEIMPLRTRNKGVALGVGAHWLSNFVVVYVTPMAIENLGYKLYIIWAVLNAIFVPITWLFFPETARRSLEEMDQVFTREKFGITHTRTPGTLRAMQITDNFEALAKAETSPPIQIDRVEDAEK